VEKENLKGGKEQENADDDYGKGKRARNKWKKRILKGAKNKKMLLMIMEKERR
jgi:hypothetical protein